MNLAAIRALPGEQIVGPGEVVESIVPLAIPAAGCMIRFGNTGDDIELDLVPPLKVCPPAGTGIFFSNSVAAPGSIAVFLVGYQDSVTADA